MRDAKRAEADRWWEEADGRHQAALERTRVCLGIARRQAAEHGYVRGEGGDQRWRSTELRGTGEDRDMSGDALTAWQRGAWKQLLEVEDMWQRRAGVPLVGEAGEAKAQCALSTLRNLLRDEEAPVELLVENQASGGGIGHYHFPEWHKVMRAAKLVRDGEEAVTFHPDQLDGPAELWDARLMAFVTTQPFAHVVAVVSGLDGEGRRCFRLYDNDGTERGRGWGRVVTTERMARWDGMMHAVVVAWSPVAERSRLPRIVPRVSGPGRGDV